MSFQLMLVAVALFSSITAAECEGPCRKGRFKAAAEAAELVHQLATNNVAVQISEQIFFAQQGVNVVSTAEL